MQRVLWTLLGVVVVGLLFVTLYVFGVAYLWHEQGFRWVYQFLVSLGLVALAFYFLLISRGDLHWRIVWGLLLLVRRHS